MRNQRDLAESGHAPDEVIQDIGGHLSKQMLKHYSHIRMEAKRRAVGALNSKPAKVEPGPISNGTGKELDQVKAVN